VGFQKRQTRTNLPLVNEPVLRDYLDELKMLANAAVSNATDTDTGSSVVESLSNGIDWLPEKRQVDKKNLHYLY
jgi:hypothetical protein